jgi:uncharacterized protein (UPF0333 family)
MIEDNKGQISIEFLLVVGAILTMVVVATPIILKNAEMNRGLTAARDGATKAAAMRGLGFSSNGGNAAGVVKIIRIETNITVIEGAPDTVSLGIYAKIPSNLDSTSVCDTIETQAQRYVAYAFTGQWPVGEVVPIADITGSYYSFTPIGCYVSS